MRSPGNDLILGKTPRTRSEPRFEQPQA